MRTLIAGILRTYKTLLSPLVGPACRFAPSCSDYAAQSVHKYGILKGLGKTLGRLLRCHPLHPGGYDPVV